MVTKIAKKDKARKPPLIFDFIIVQVYALRTGLLFFIFEYWYLPTLRTVYAYPFCCCCNSHKPRELRRGRTTTGMVPRHIMLHRSLQASTFFDNSIVITIVIKRVDDDEGI